MISQLEWDMATITAGDYTVEQVINAETFQSWYDTHYKAPGGDFHEGISAAYSMKTHIKQRVEDYLNEALHFKQA